MLGALHVQTRYPQAPISNALAMELLVFLLLLAYFLMVRMSLSAVRARAANASELAMRPLLLLAQVMTGPRAKTAPLTGFHTRI